MPIAFIPGGPGVQGTVDGWRMAHQPTTAGDGDRQPILRVERIHVTAADTPPAGR